MTNEYARLCMNRVGDDCRLESAPCKGLCAQWNMANRNLIADLGKGMVAEDKKWMTRRGNAVADYYDLINSYPTLSASLSERITNRSETQMQSRLDVVADERVEPIPEHMLETEGAVKLKAEAAWF